MIMTIICQAELLVTSPVVGAHTYPSDLATASGVELFDSTQAVVRTRKKASSDDVVEVGQKVSSLAQRQAVPEVMAPGLTFSHVRSTVVYCLVYAVVLAFTAVAFFF